MPSSPPSTRRLALAITAAVASTTVAVGVTAGMLLGWFRPTTAPPPITEPAPIVEPSVPQPAAVEPATQLAVEPMASDAIVVQYVDSPRASDDDDDEREHHDRHRHHEDDDD